MDSLPVSFIKSLITARIKSQADIIKALQTPLALEHTNTTKLEAITTINQCNHTIYVLDNLLCDIDSALVK